MMKYRRTYHIGSPTRFFMQFNQHFIHFYQIKFERIGETLSLSMFTADTEGYRIVLDHDIDSVSIRRKKSRGLDAGQRNWIGTGGTGK
jgi:hypothetical protein